MVLIEYLSFLKSKYPDALATENARLLKIKDIPLLRFFTHLKESDILDAIKKGLLKLIDDFENAREYEALETGLKRWLNNETTGFTKEQVKIEDLINIYGAQKEALLHFVHLFTSEASICVQIFKEIEAYYNTAYRRTIDMFIHIHNEELKASEKKYRLLAENSSDIISKQTTAGIITYISPSCKSVLGYDPNEMLGKNSSDFIHADDLPLAGEERKKLEDANRVETTTIRMRRKDGNYIWLEVTAKNITDPLKNETIEVHTSARNVTARKITEDKLRQNEVLLSESQRIAKIGSWEWNIKTNELKWTLEHYALYGVDPSLGNITYEIAELLRHPDDTEHVHKNLAATLKDNKPLDFVHRLIVNGNVKVLHVKGERVMQNGELLMLRGTSQDITHISHIQQQMIKKNHQLEEAQHIASLGSWEWDTQNDWVVWSDEMYRLFDYEPGSVTINFDFYLSHIFPADREYVKEQILACYQQGRQYSFENRIITKNGQLKWLHATGQVSEKRGEINWVLSGTAHDITERKNIELALDEKIQDLERSNNDLQLFASIASHDLKEPLRKIRTNASILTDNYAALVDPKIRKYIDRMDASAIRMERLIEDVLSVSKITRKKDVLIKTDLNKIINNCLNDLEIQIKDKNAVINVDKLPEDLLVNPEQIYQLFQNIIANALKFSNDTANPAISICAGTAGPELIKNTLARFDKYCSIVFKDNGIGFEQVFADKIFIMFQRLHGKEKYDGNGIGLAICKKIIENHEGFIEAYGEPGKGATFTVYLPFRTVEA